MRRESIAGKESGAAPGRPSVEEQKGSHKFGGLKTRTQIVSFFGGSFFVGTISSLNPCRLGEKPRALPDSGVATAEFPLSTSGARVLGYQGGWSVLKGNHGRATGRGHFFVREEVPKKMTHPDLHLSFLEGRAAFRACNYRHGKVWSYALLV